MTERKIWVITRRGKHLVNEQKLITQCQCIYGRDPCTTKRLECFPTICRRKAVTTVPFYYDHLKSGDIILEVPVCEKHKDAFTEWNMLSRILPLKTCAERIKDALEGANP